MLLISIGLGHLLISLGYPEVNYELTKEFKSQGVAIQKLVELATIIISCGLYKIPKTRYMIKASLAYVYGLSVLLSSLLLGITLYKYIPIVYFVGHLFSTIVLYTYLGRSVTGLRAWYFTESKDRENYDNDKNLITGIMGGLGFLSMSIFHMPFKSSVILLTLGGILVSVGWLKIFLENKKEYLKDNPFS